MSALYDLPADLLLHLRNFPEDYKPTVEIGWEVLVVGSPDSPAGWIGRVVALSRHTQSGAISYLVLESPDGSMSVRDRRVATAWTRVRYGTDGSVSAWVSRGEEWPLQAVTPAPSPGR